MHGTACCTEEDFAADKVEDDYEYILGVPFDSEPVHVAAEAHATAPAPAHADSPRSSSLSFKTIFGNGGCFGGTECGDASVCVTRADLNDYEGAPSFGTTSTSTNWCPQYSEVKAHVHVTWTVVPDILSYVHSLHLPIANSSPEYGKSYA